MRQRDLYMGVDLGQSHDYTAITVVERIHRRRDGETRVIYRLGHLDRLQLGTSYPEQVETIKQLRERLLGNSVHIGGEATREASVEIIVDATGVGRPVVDMLQKEGLKVRPVVITGGDKETHTDGFYRVPKRNLVSVGQVLLQTGRLVIQRTLPLAGLLTKEMFAFKVQVSRAGHDSYGNDWRENDHDDLVLAALLAVWWPERSNMRANLQDARAKAGLVGARRQFS